MLTVTQILRKEGVVNKFVEYFGPAIKRMKVADRALVANMAPEYGATMGFFPIDEQTLAFLRLTGRSDAEVALVERYTKEQQLFYGGQPGCDPSYTKVLKLDLGTIEPSLAGPKRPQDRVPLANVKQVREVVASPVKERGFGLGEQDRPAPQPSSTTATAPSIGARRRGYCRHHQLHEHEQSGCHARRRISGQEGRPARAVGQTVREDQPGPRQPCRDRLLPQDGPRYGADKLGFNLVGYGCTTCIGNSGPLPEAVAEAVVKGGLVAAAVLSGNRNFEGRINPHVKANYLASPPLVVAYALAGTVDIDLATEPLGMSSDGRPVYLKDVWPSREEVARVVADAVGAEMFRARYENVFEVNPTWNALPVASSELFPWDAGSSYIQEPPFLIDLAAQPGPIQPLRGARVLAALGDSVTTDHISPAGAIAATSPAGKYLQERGVKPVDFNSYGARRGNDRVMTRGTFANIRIRNLLVPGVEGGVTRHLPDGEVMPIYDAAMKYKAEGTPLVVLAGAEYGTGSSRDGGSFSPAS